MRTRNILIILGALFILVNLPVYFSSQTVPEASAVNRIAYLIGLNLFLVVGLVLLFIAWLIHKKVAGKRKQMMFDDFLSDSSRTRNDTF